MQRRVFGSTGREVGVIGQGTWRLRDRAGAVEALREGLAHGMDHVDTAEMYTGSEAVIREALRDVDRERVFLASKVLPRHASAEGTRRALDATLDRLGTDYVDLYYLHWWSDTHPIGETMRAMEDLVDEGKVRHIGVSNFGVDELEAAREALRRHELAANQVLHHLGAREAENEVRDYCREHDVALVGYSPFGSGSFPSPDSPGGRVLAEVADAHDATPHQVALNFLARHGGAFPIPKAETVAHVRDNAKALTFTLTDEQVARIDEAFPRPAAGTPLRVV